MFDFIKKILNKGTVEYQGRTFIFSYIPNAKIPFGARIVGIKKLKKNEDISFPSDTGEKRYIPILSVSKNILKKVNVLSYPKYFTGKKEHINVVLSESYRKEEENRNIKERCQRNGLRFVKSAFESYILKGYDKRTVKNKYTIPSEIDGFPVRDMGYGVFKGNTSVEEIIFDKDCKINSIGIEAFSGTSIKEIEVPDSIGEIKRDAFKDCINLTYISLPASVKIKTDPFHGCSNLKTIYVRGEIKNKDILDLARNNRKIVSIT